MRAASAFVALLMTMYVQTMCTAIAADVDPGRAARSSRSESFTLAAVGDVIYVEPMLPLFEKMAPEVLSLLRNADATFGNFEATAIDVENFTGYPEAESGGAWIIAADLVPQDLKSMGFDLMSVANNHTLDWGVVGLAESLQRLSEAGLVYAGAGRTLSGARAPRYFFSPTHRLALTAITSTFPLRSRASDPLGEVNGRPGVNGLRLEAPNDAGGVLPTMNRRDLQEMLRSISQGEMNSDLSVVSLHTHEFGADPATPAPFAVEFAHQAIDAGADVVVGHGVHQLQGIEVYKGKPIFYSLGNFMFSLDALEIVPPEMYEGYNVEPDAMSAAEFMRYRNGLVHSLSNRFEGVIATTRYDGGRAVEVQLHPVDLGYTSKGLDRGLPRTPTTAMAKRILINLQRLSRSLGTDLVIRGNVGVIAIRSE